MLLYLSERTCSTASCRCTVSPAVPGVGSTFVPSTRMAQLLQMKAKQFPRQWTGPVRALVIPTDSTLWAGSMLEETQKIQQHLQKSVCGGKPGKQNKTKTSKKPQTNKQKGEYSWVKFPQQGQVLTQLGEPVLSPAFAGALGLGGQGDREKADDLAEEQQAQEDPRSSREGNAPGPVGKAVLKSDKGCKEPGVGRGGWG